MSVHAIRRFAPQAYGLMACLLLSLVLTGCGKKEPFTHAHIKGKITYEDGTPIPADRVRVIFHPQAAPIDPKTHPRPGEVDLQPDGSFSDVTSHKYADGVVIGKHKVTIIPLDAEERELKVVPKEYMRVETTPLMIDTTDFSEETPIEIKIPKP